MARKNVACVTECSRKKAFIFRRIVAHVSYTRTACSSSPCSFTFDTSKLTPFLLEIWGGEEPDAVAIVMTTFVEHAFVHAAVGGVV